MRDELLQAPAGLEKSSTGLDPRLAAALACFGWWLTGVLFLFLERDSRFVRYHAAQAVVVLGGFWLLATALLGASFLSLLVTATGFQPLLDVSRVASGAGIVLWLGCLIPPLLGRTWKIPGAAPLAERLAARRPAGKLSG
jgi:uncharacterized membrane protein